ncbi:hypothetical protein Cenrod_2250 [Candidatus Symbiobacter mobilis CR]|uniref:Uncharacterized protein n=1 Tax=Candidatus Symbiobacter mobilis CR TaxID=946483 RepID=U5NAG9_9BURK|nr:hypothetical protein Cenrod_2250 [Candidatus Symbiobacter mobilis CR]
MAPNFQFIPQPVFLKILTTKITGNRIAGKANCLKHSAKVFGFLDSEKSMSYNKCTAEIMGFADYP